MTAPIQNRLTEVSEYAKWLRKEQAATFEVLKVLMQEARDAGEPVTRIAELAGVSRPTVYEYTK